MPAAVLAQYQTALRNPDGLRFHDLVRSPFLQITVLMDTRFMRECIAPHDRFIRLRTEADNRAQHLAGGEKMLRVDTGSKGIPVVARLHHHYDLFERAVPRPFA